MSDLGSIVIIHVAEEQTPIRTADAIDNYIDLATSFEFTGREEIIDSRICKMVNISIVEHKRPNSRFEIPTVLQYSDILKGFPVRADLAARSPRLFADSGPHIHCFAPIVLDIEGIGFFRRSGCQVNEAMITQFGDLYSHVLALWDRRLAKAEHIFLDEEQGGKILVTPSLYHAMETYAACGRSEKIAKLNSQVHSLASCIYNDVYERTRYQETCFWVAKSILADAIEAVAVEELEEDFVVEAFIRGACLRSDQLQVRLRSIYLGFPKKIDTDSSIYSFYELYNPSLIDVLARKIPEDIGWDIPSMIMFYHDVVVDLRILLYRMHASSCKDINCPHIEK